MSKTSCNHRIYAESYGYQPMKKGWAVLMAKSRAEVDRLPKSERELSESFEGHLWERAYAEPMFCPRYVSGWCMSKRKRCFDLMLSIIALIVFSPLMLLIAWLIRFTSQGPALFRQERVGLHQQTFVIFKFRT